MSGVALRYDLAMDGALRAFGDLASRAASTRPLMDAIGVYLQSETRMRFEDQVGPDGVAWRPSQRAIEQAGQTLVDTGRLRDSITHLAEDGAVEVGTDVLYGAIHQFGGRIEPRTASALRFRIGERWVTAGRVDMPARPYLGLAPEDEPAIAELVGAYLLDAMP